MLQRGLRFIEVIGNTPNRTVITLSCATFAVALTGCSTINNGSMDYKNAQAIAPVQVSETFKTRQIAPLYPVPVVPSNAASEALVISNSKGTSFIVPKPKPLDESTISTAQIGDGTPSAPELVIDGNGYPILKISGDAGKVWEIINRTLSVANVDVKTRNVAASRFDVVIDKTTYQLRLGRIGNVTTVILQKADDSLADKAIATDLLERITQNWSA